MESYATVFVVDDDDAIRESLRRLMESVGLGVETYPSAQAFLDRYDPARPGCMILDIRMPGMNGLELQEKLVKERIRIPIIIVSAHGDVEKAVRAMRTGALDFIRKPYDPAVLLDCVRHAIELDLSNRSASAESAELTARVDLLSSREREVMKLITAGKNIKQIALELGLSAKTVDVHRHHIMLKLRANSLTDLGRIAEMCDALQRSTPAPSRDRAPRP